MDRNAVSWIEMQLVRLHYEAPHFNSSQVPLLAITTVFVRVNLCLCRIFAINWSFDFRVLFVSWQWQSCVINLGFYIVAGSYGEVYRADWNGTVSQIF